MDIITIILFFIYLYGFGFTALSFVKKPEDFFERSLMTLGVGLVAFPFFGFLLSLLHIPLDWKIFLVASLIYPVYYLIKNRKYIKTPDIKLTSTLFILAILFGVTLFMYERGAFSYPYLEDDDPWEHAKSISYVTVEKNIKSPDYTFNYMDPYPASYDMIMGVLHQTSPSVSWTMKFFNALIISLCIPFFFYFAKELLGSRQKALLSAFMLAAIPCFLSHFIWALALLIPVSIVAFYALEMIKHDKKWMYVAALALAGVILAQPSSAVKIGIMFALYWAVKAITEKKAWHVFGAGFIGLVLSILVWWGPLILSMGFSDLKDSLISPDLIGAPEKGFSFRVIGTADRPYVFNDYFIAQSQNLINNPVGIGWVMFILASIGLIFFFLNKGDIKKSSTWIIIAWLAFTLFGVNGARLPIQFFAFRFWMLLAIPVSLLAAIGTFDIIKLLKNRIPEIIIIIVVVLGVFGTSFYQKYSVNTSMWPYGVSWHSYEEVLTYTWLKENPTKTFGYCSEESSMHIIGFDNFDCTWCSAEQGFRPKAFNATANETISFLKSNGYQRMLIDSSCIENYGLNETNDKIGSFVSTGKFAVEHQSAGYIALKVL